MSRISSAYAQQPFGVSIAIAEAKQNGGIACTLLASRPARHKAPSLTPPLPYIFIDMSARHLPIAAALHLSRLL